MNLWKKILCKHKKTVCIGHVIDGGDNNRYTQKNVWKCQDCGKEFYGKMKVRKHK